MSQSLADGRGSVSGLRQSAGPRGAGKLRESYDWIVVGNHPAAVLSGALLAKLGLSVLQLSFFDSPSRKISKGGQWVEWESNCLPGFAPGGLGWNLLEYLGALKTELALFSAEEEFMRIQTPSDRLLFGTGNAGVDSLRDLEVRLPEVADWTSKLKVLERAVPQVWINSFQKTIWGSVEGASLPGHGASKGIVPDPLVESLGGIPIPSDWKSPAHFQARALSWWLGRAGMKGRSADLLDDFWQKDPARLAWGRALVADLWGTSPEKLPAGALVHALAFLRWTASFRGGRSAFQSFLNRLAARNGVQIASPIECRKIFYSSKTITGVQTNVRGGLIRARGVALGCSVDQALDLLGPESAGKIGDDAVRPESWCFTLALTVKASAFPHPHARRSLWSEEGASPVEIEWVLVEELPFPDRSRYFVFIRSRLPWGEHSLSPAFQRIEAARLHQLFERLYPGARAHQVRLFPDYRNDSRDFLDAYPFKSLREIPESLRVYSSTKLAVGNGSLSRFSGIDGLFLCNGTSQSEFGRLGFLGRAVDCAAWVAHRSGLPGPFSSRSVLRGWSAKADSAGEGEPSASRMKKGGSS